MPPKKQPRIEKGEKNFTFGHASNKVIVTTSRLGAVVSESEGERSFSHGFSKYPSLLSLFIL